MADPIATLDDATLARMIDRAYREAARSLAELKVYRAHDAVRDMLAESANSALDYHAHLAAEQKRREANAA
jgi:hypothetical protein